MRNMFLSVGAMKAGTTFLFNVLRQHPEIYFTHEKELHFFAHYYGLDPELYLPLLGRGAGKPVHKIRQVMSGRHLQHQILTSDFRRHRLSAVMRGRFSRVGDPELLRDIVTWYTDRYMIDPIDQNWIDRIFAEAGDHYAADFSNYNALLGTKVWRSIKGSVEGKLRVIYVMRHPVQRLWSHYKFDRQQAGRPISADKVGHKAALEVLEDADISAHARYGDIVESLLTGLDETDFLPLFLEEILEKPEAELNRIVKFLGVRDHKFKVDTAKKVNQSKQAALPDSIRDSFRQAVKPQLLKLKAIGVEPPPSYFD